MSRTVVAAAVAGGDVALAIAAACTEGHVCVVRSIGQTTRPSTRRNPRRKPRSRNYPSPLSPAPRETQESDPHPFPPPPPLSPRPVDCRRRRRNRPSLLPRGSPPPLSTSLDRRRRPSPLPRGSPPRAAFPPSSPTPSRSPVPLHQIHVRLRRGQGTRCLAGFVRASSELWARNSDPDLQARLGGLSPASHASPASGKHPLMTAGGIALSWISRSAIGLVFGRECTQCYFDGKTYEWVGLSRQRSIMGKVKRSSSQFTPAQWDKDQWHPFMSPLRFIQVLFLCVVFMTVELNTFFLKFCLWIPPRNPLVVYRLILWWLIAIPFPTIREYNSYIPDSKPVKKVGAFC